MARDVLERISQISSILGLWTFVAIVASIIICYRGVSYVSGLSGTVLTTTLSLTRSSARYITSLTLAKKPEGEFKASRMRYNL